MSKLILVKTQNIPNKKAAKVAIPITVVTFISKFLIFGEFGLFLPTYDRFQKSGIAAVGSMARRHGYLPIVSYLFIYYFFLSYTLPSY